MMNYTVRDRVSYRTSLRALRGATFGVIDALQVQSKDVQVEAAGLAFVAMCMATGLDPHEMVVRHKNQLSDANAVRDADIQAIADYAKGELT